MRLLNKVKIFPRNYLNTPAKHKTQRENENTLKPKKSFNERSF